MRYLNQANGLEDAIGVEYDRSKNPPVCLIPLFPLPAKRLGVLAIAFCKHENTVPFVRIDRRAGPGSFADNYKGVACLSCTKILSEEKI